MVRSVHLLCHEVYNFLEFFAGEANVTWCTKYCGFRSLNFDYTYGGRYNNFFEPSGFAHFGCKMDIGHTHTDANISIFTYKCAWRYVPIVSK